MERNLILALSLVAILVPSYVLAAPTLLEQLMDVNAVDTQDEAMLQSLEKRDAELDTEPFQPHRRSRRASMQGRLCMGDCWFCTTMGNGRTIDMGPCVQGCMASGQATNPLIASTWSRCARTVNLR